jgi:uncharacterized protein (TIGR00290 family)
MNHPFVRSPVAVSWSGGKDSSLMLERLLDDPSVEVVTLLTSVTTEYDRVSIHGVRRSILHRQAESLGLPLHEVELGARTSNAFYEQAFLDALRQLERHYPGLNTMAFGDLFLEDVRDYREALLARAGWRGLYPLWGLSTTALAAHFVDRGYEAYLSCVDTEQLDARYVGARFDAAFLASLPDSVDPCGERGEFHSCVVDGPIFRSPIAVELGERVLRDERFMYCDLLEQTSER